MPIADRIRELRRVPARQLRPHPQNWRTHNDRQRDALRGVLAEIGYAGALLARELPDGSLQLLDGHLRAQTTPDQDVPVLIVDVNEAEAQKLLLTLDPLAALAGTDDATLDGLLNDVETDDAALRALWDELHTERAALDESLGTQPIDDDAAADAPADADDASGLAYEKFPRLHRPPTNIARTAKRGSRTSVPEVYQLVVECTDEAEQESLYEHLRKLGHRVRVVNL